MMPPDGFNPVTFGSFGFIGEDGITWTPVGHIDLQESTFCCEPDDAFPDVKDLLSTSETMTLDVSFVDFKWLRKLLGLPRYDFIWAYRRERKGHPRCR